MSVARARIRVVECGVARPALQSLPLAWLGLGLVAALWFALWATSTRVLQFSDLHEGGHVRACHYFTGAGMAERQYAAGDAAQHICKFVVRVS